MPNVVKLGGTEYPIQRFKGLKAILAMAQITRIGQEAPDIMSRAAREYSKRNMIEVTEQMAALPRWSGFSKEDFDRAEKQSGERIIRLPEPMDENAVLLASLPDLFEKARRQVIRLMAILIIPNNELAAADRDDKVDEALDTYQEVLLYEAELDELADLVLAAQDVLTDQLSNTSDRLGKLVRSLWSMWTRRGSRQQSTADQILEATETKTVPTSPTSPAGLPTSSTDSPPPTDGVGSTLSTTSPGAS